MQDGESRINFLREHGAQLIESGYTILPLNHKEKFCRIKGWPELNLTISDLKTYLDSGMEGIGINTRYNPSVDMDIEDFDTVQQLKRYCYQEIGATPSRIGNAPRCALVYRTDTPFKKIKSNVYVDNHGREHSVEILCDGQALAAYGYHPKTDGIYEWHTGYSLTEFRHSELPELTAAKSHYIIKKFHAIAEKKQWRIKSIGTREDNSVALPDDVSLAPVVINEGDIKRHLSAIDPDLSYDDWIRVGMALHHQFTGGSKGLELWDRYSSRGFKYKKGECASLWERFGSHTGRPLTYRTVINMYNDTLNTLDTKQNIDEKTFEEKLLGSAKSAQPLPPSDQGTEPSSDDDDDDDDDEDAVLMYGSLVKKQDMPVESTSLKSSIDEDSRYECMKWRRPEFYQRPRNLDDCLERFVLLGKDSKVVDMYHPLKPKQKMTDFHNEYKYLHSVEVEEATEKAKKPKVNITYFTRIWESSIKAKRAYDCVYHPNRPLYYLDLNTNLKYVNTFEFPPHARESIGQIDTTLLEPIFEHLHYLIPDDVSYDWFLGWLAFSIQRPDIRCKVIPLHISPIEGTGRGWLKTLIQKLVDVRNTSNASMGDLCNYGRADTKTGFLLDCIICFVDEVEDGKNEMLGSNVRSILTEDTLRVNVKYGADDPRARVFANVIMFSNSWQAITLPVGSRRFMIIEGASQKRPPEHFTKIYNHINNPDVISHFFHWLNRLDLTNFSWQDAPYTKAKARLESNSLSVLAKTFYEFLCSESHIALTAAQLDHALLELCKDKDLGSLQELRRGFKDPGYRTLKQQHLVQTRNTLVTLPKSLTSDSKALRRRPLVRPEYVNDVDNIRKSVINYFEEHEVF